MQLRNDKSGEVINSDLTNAQAAAKFAELHGDNPNHWLWFWIHKAAQGAKKPAQTGNVSGALRFIADSFLVAAGYGLKKPMIRCHYRGRRFKIYLSAKGTVCVKSGRLAPITVVNAAGQTVPATYHGVNAAHPEGCRGCKADKALIGQVAYSNDPAGDEEYVGCLLYGKFLPACPRFQDANGRWVNGPERKPDADEQGFLDGLAADPVNFLAQCSRDMDRCCYCSQPLEDARSKRLGYGSTCAKRWGLPWGDKEYTEKAPSFASRYNDDAAGFCESIRKNPGDTDLWAVFGNWLEEQGLPRCKAPDAAKVRLARN